VDAAGALGCELVVVKCTPDELRTLAVPVIVLKERTVDHGGFCLIRSIGHGAWLQINGGTFEYEAITEDMFRRYWSGYAILRRQGRKPANSRTLAAAVFGVTIGLAALYQFSRRRARRLAAGT